MTSKATKMSALCSAQLRLPPSAMRCADLTRPLCVRVLDSTGNNELQCSCFRINVQGSCSQYTRGNETQMFPWRAESSTPFPAEPGLAPPPSWVVSVPDQPWFVRVLILAGFLPKINKQDSLGWGPRVEMFRQSTSTNQSKD